MIGVGTMTRVRPFWVFEMNVRLSALVMILICGILVAAEQNASTGKQYQITVSVVDESETRNIKQQRSALISDETFRFHDGGEFRPDSDGAGLKFGIGIVGTIKDSESGGKRIELTVEFMNKVSCKDTRTQIVAGDVLKIRTDIDVGKSKRIHCGGQRYCVLLID